MTDNALGGLGQPYDAEPDTEKSAILEQKYCSGCAAKIHKAAPLCPHCGAPQAGVSAGLNVQPKSRAVAIVLALFLGGLGAHKFYLNKPGTGLLYLVFVWTLVPALIALVEAVGYICMSDEAFAQRFSPGAAALPPGPLGAPLRRPDWQPGDGPRSVTPLLGFGIFLLPMVFVWFLLRPGYSVLTRAVGFTWLAVLFAFTLFSAEAARRPVAPAPAAVPTSAPPAPVHHRPRHAAAHP